MPSHFHLPLLISVDSGHEPNEANESRENLLCLMGFRNVR
jgi:hypothetical protein